MPSASSWTERSAERCNFLVVSAENHRSTRFIHDPYVGVKCKWKRLWRNSHLCTVGVLCAERLSEITWTSRSLGTLRSTLFKNATKSALVWRGRGAGMTFPPPVSGGADKAQARVP